MKKNNMRPLYQISAEYAQTLDALSAMEMLTPEIISDTLQAVKDEFENKALNVAAMIKNILADAEKIKEAEEGMAKRRKRLQEEAKHLEDYLIKNLAAIDFKGRIESPEHEIGLADCPLSVKIENEEHLRKTLGKDYLRYKEPELDINKIKETLKNGAEIEGATLIRKKRLILK